MRKLFTVVLVTFSLFSAVSAQTKIEGETFPNTISTDKGELVLNGGGVREKAWIDVYVGALYLTAKSDNATEIVSGDKPMAVRLHIVSGMVNSDNMSEAINEGFKKSVGENITYVQTRIDAFIKVFSEPIKVGDIFKLVYLPNEGVKIYKNEVYKSTVSGLDFKKALFGIWLGSDPVSAGLKKGMLGQ